jgi:hypothetical protein
MENRYAPPQANVSDAGMLGGAVSTAMVDAMRGTKPWVLLVGITLLVFGAFSVLASIGILASSAMMGPDGERAGITAGMGGTYVVLSAIYGALGYYLVKYSSAIGKLLSGGQSADLEQALHQQRKFWKLSGIIFLVLLVLLVVGIAAAIVVPLLTK